MRKYSLILVSIVVSIVFISATTEAAPPAPVVTKSKSKVAAKSSKVSAKSKKKKIDYNALGLATMQKKNYSDAIRFFDLATMNDPKNSLAWINRARALVELSIGTEPIDYCDYAHNWIFDGLSSLSNALEANRAKTIAALKNVKDPGFAKFRQRPEFKRWLLLTTLPLKTDVATQEFFSKHNDWLIPKQPMPATIVTFAPNHDLTITTAEGGREVGSWTAGADRVVVKQATNLKTMGLTTFNFVYDGKKSFKQVVLKDQNSAEQWFMGPMIADCPN